MPVQHIVFHSTQESDGTCFELSITTSLCVPIYNGTRGVNLCIRHEEILWSVWFQERDFLAPR